MPKELLHQFNYTFTRDNLVASLSLASLLEGECWAILETLQSHPCRHLRRNCPSICGDDDLFRFRRREACPSFYQALVVRDFHLHPIFYKSINVRVGVIAVPRSHDHSLEGPMTERIRSD
jgi:hypothetical protein